jgi:DNA-binding MarR family transcriptional regulator
LKHEVSNLEDHLGYWMRSVSNHVSHAFRLKVETRGVTLAEWVMMRALFDRDTANPSQLAEQVELTRGAVSKLVDRLIVKGFVVCRTGNPDRRYQELTLSPSGRRLVPKLAELADENDREFFGHLSDQEREVLGDMLRSITKVHGIKSVPIE